MTEIYGKTEAHWLNKCIMENFIRLLGLLCGFVIVFVVKSNKIESLCTLRVMIIGLIMLNEDSKAVSSEETIILFQIEW